MRSSCARRARSWRARRWQVIAKADAMKVAVDLYLAAFDAS
jgi:hypothetical protein